MSFTKKLSLEHVVRPARSGSGRPPVLLLLHGYGSNEEDLFSFAPALDKRYLIVSARAPLPLGPNGYAWYNIAYREDGKKFKNDKSAISSRDLIVTFIDEVVELYGGDPNRVSLMGFSQGAILSYAVALSFPRKIQNVVAMSGYIDQDLLRPDYAKGDFLKLSFYCSHGEVDEVVPVQWGRKTKPFLDKLKIENTYSEFPVGHGVSPENFEEIKEWLTLKVG